MIEAVAEMESVDQVQVREKTTGMGPLDSVQ
jgi:hypothetical protein